LLVIMLIGRFIPGSSFLDIALIAWWAFCVLAPRSWILCLLLAGRFVPGSSFLGVVLIAC